MGATGTSLRGSILTLVVASAAAAQPIAVTSVVLDQSETYTAQSLQVWVELEAALRNDDRLAVARAGPKALETQGGAEALARAGKLRQGGRLEEAAQAYAEAVERFTRSDWRDSFEGFIEALAWNAALQKNQADLSLLFTARPDFEFPPGALPDDLAAGVELQRRGKAKAARSAFVIESPTRAVVWVDGRLAGVTPVTTESLVGGRHRLTAFAPGFPLLQSVELLTPGTPVRLTFPDSLASSSAREAHAAVAAAFKQDTPEAAARQLREASGTAELLVVVLSPGGAEVARVGPTVFTRERVKGEASLPAVLAAVRALYDRPLLNSEPPASQPVRALPLVFLASGAAALAGGGVLLAVSRGQIATSLQIPQTETARYDQLLGSARATGYSSYVLLPVGAMLAALGTWLWLRDPAPQPLSLWLGPGGVSASGTF